MLPLPFRILHCGLITVLFFSLFLFLPVRDLSCYPVTPRDVAERAGWSMRIIYLRQNHKRTDTCMRGTKRGRLPRYIIIILLRFISTLFHDPIFNTLSQFFSLLDINSTAYNSTRLLLLLRFCPCTPILCFCFYLSLTRSLS